MERLHRSEPARLTERVLQFGEGNFLRGFVDWMFDRLNREAGGDFGVVVVQPRPSGRVAELAAQDGLYTLCLHGRQNGEAVEESCVVESIVRCIDPYRDWDAYMDCARNPDLRYIVSNTTEAGIEYVKGKETFPSRLAHLLVARFEAGLPGFVFLPCELIENNAGFLRDCVERYAHDWECGPAFFEWLRKECVFANTLVDRIVTGFPKDPADAPEAVYGYSDPNLDTGELFHLWVIEGDEKLAKELPFASIGLQVLFVKDLTPYRQRKVRILNGAHTMMVPAAYLCGHTTVFEAMQDREVRSYMEKGIFEEIIPTLDLPREELETFARDTVERFDNPYIKHYLLSIALNSVSKWRVRVLPSLKEYEKRFGSAPARLTFSLAALIAFYRNGQPDDAPDVIDRLRTAPLAAILSGTDFWGEDLSRLLPAVEGYLTRIDAEGIRAVIGELA